MSPHFCLTASGCLIHQGKVLLVKHRKLEMWLNPGGHLDPGEKPHQGAEREFFEETGVEVEAYGTNITAPAGRQLSGEKDLFLPNPIATNLHWISEDNYQARLESERNKGADYARDPLWQKGCEQHLNFLYLMKLKNADAGTKITHDERESLASSWFGRQDLEKLKIWPAIRSEIELAFDLSTRVDQP